MPLFGAGLELKEAAELGNLERVRELLSSDPLPKEITPRALATALLLAVRYDHLEMARLLLQQGADPNETAVSKLLNGIIEAARSLNMIRLLRSYNAQGKLSIPENLCDDCGSEIFRLPTPISEFRILHAPGSAPNYTRFGKCSGCQAEYYHLWRAGNCSPWQRGQPQR